MMGALVQLGQMAPAINQSVALFAGGSVLGGAGGAAAASAAAGNAAITTLGIRAAIAARFVEPTGRKLGKMIGRWGGSGGRDAFMEHSSQLATDARQAGQVVIGQVQGARVAIYRLGETYMKVDAVSRKILSYVRDADSSWGIVKAYR